MSSRYDYLPELHRLGEERVAAMLAERDEEIETLSREAERLRDARDEQQGTVAAMWDRVRELENRLEELQPGKHSFVREVIGNG
jgi:phage shock protein A